MPPTQQAHDAFALSAQEVSIEFGGVKALSNIDMSFPAGAIVGVIGPNGAGKSTLLGVFSGLFRPDTGRVYLGGTEVTDLPAHDRARRGLARTFQRPELFAGLSLRDHLLLADRVRHAPSRVLRDVVTGRGLRRPSESETERVDGVIDLLGIGDLVDRDVLSLPLGSSRLVEVARALATDPSVMLLDEPFSGLDEHETRRLSDTLVSVVNDRKTSLVLVEHDIETVLDMCSYVHVMDAGRRVASGSPAAVRNDPVVQEAFLGTVASSGAAVRRRPLAPLASGPEVPGPEALGPEAGGPSLLSVENVSVRYGSARALTGVSLELRAGATTAVLGANGAGKSTLARAISGLVPVADGSIRFFGSDITRWSPHRIRRAGLVYLPEGRGVFPGLSVRDNLQMAVATLPRSERREAVERAVESFPRLGERLRQVAGSLSGGEQQMLSVARALAVSPRLIIADELSLGLAPRAVDAVFEALTVAMSAGTAILLIEQFVERAMELAGSCIILQRGVVRWSGQATDVAAEVLDRYLGVQITDSSAG
jgi:branched-chain amino acid transport system ATP-binding protein